MFLTSIIWAPFFCTFIYEATEKNDCLHLFSQLESISKDIDKPWIALGDFNCIANFNKRIGQVVRMQEIMSLGNFMSSYGLTDMKFYGRFYSWNNKQLGDRRVFSKIDKVLGNDVWVD